MAALCASRWSAISRIDWPNKKPFHEGKTEGLLCLPWVGSQPRSWHEQKNPLTRAGLLMEVARIPLRVRRDRCGQMHDTATSHLCGLTESRFTGALSPTGFEHLIRIIEGHARHDLGASVMPQNSGEQNPARTSQPGSAESLFLQGSPLELPSA
jgi:hypothetical protein